MAVCGRMREASMACAPEGLRVQSITSASSLRNLQSKTTRKALILPTVQ